MFLWFVCLVLVAVRSNLARIVQDSDEKVFYVNSYGDYQSYIKTKDLNSHRIFLVIVHESMKDQCPFCGQFKEQFVEMSKKYNEKHHPNLMWGVMAFQPQAEFQRIAQDLQIKSVPAVFVYRSKSDTRRQCHLNQQHLFDCITQNTGLEPPEELKKLMKEQQRRMSSRQSHGGNLKLTVVFWLVFFAFIMTIAALSYCVFFAMGNWKRYIILMVLFIVFVICVGCIVYNMINNPGLTYGNSLFYPQQRQQMRLEGYACACVIIVFACSWIALTDFLGKHPLPMPGEFGGPFFRFLIQNRDQMVSYFLFFLIIFCFLVVFHCYLLKYGWYMHDIPYFNLFAAIVKNVPFGALFAWFEPK